MSHELIEDPIILQFERLLRVLKKQRGVAEGDDASTETAGAPRQVPFFEKRVGDLRYSQQAKIHGNPAGLAKGTRIKRQRRIEEFRHEVGSLGSEDQTAHFDALDALGFALDAERLLGSFNRVGSDPFPTSQVDAVAERLVVWLAEKGYQITPISAQESVE